MASSKNNQRPMELQRDVTEDLERTRSDIIKQPIHSNAFSTVRFVENKPIKFVAPLRSLSFVKSEQELTELQKRSSDLSRTSSSTIRDLQRIAELDKEQQRRTETEKRRDSASRLQRRRTKRTQRRLVAEEEDNKLQNKYNEEDNASGDERFAPECVSLHREASQVEILQKKKWAYRWVASIACVDFLTWFVYLFVFATYVQYQVLSSPEMEWMLSKQMRSLAGNQKKLAQVTTVDEMYKWMDDTLIEKLAQDKTNIFHKKHLKQATDLTYQTINGYFYVLENNIYLRQIRCKQGACRKSQEPGEFFVHAGFAGNQRHMEQDNNFPDDDDWMWQRSEEEDAIPVNCHHQPSIGKRYFSAKDTRNTPTEARIRGIDVFLSGSGFVEELSLTVDAASIAAPRNTTLFYRQYDHLLAHTKSCMKAKVKAMQKVGWVDERTRAVFIEYCVQPQNITVQNTSYAEAGACHRIIFTISPSGLVASTQAIMTAPIFKDKQGKMINNQQCFSWVAGSCLFLFLIKEVTEFVYAMSDTHAKWVYLTPQNIGWNVLDLIIISALSATIHWYPSVSPFDPSMIETTLPTYERIHFLEELSQTRANFGIVMFLWFLRGLEYVRLIPSFRLPILAISKALYNLVTFMFFFTFILYGGSLTFRFLYGTSSAQYSTLFRTITSMSMASLGEIKVDLIQLDYRFVHAQSLSIVWAFLATFVLLTMFVAIVDEGFQSAKTELNPDPKTGAQVTVETILVDQSVVTYEGKVKRVNVDGTFDIKFVNPTDKKSYVDLGIRRKQIHHEQYDDINDSIFIAILRYHLEPRFVRLYNFCSKHRAHYMNNKVNVMVRQRSLTRSPTIVLPVVVPVDSKLCGEKEAESKKSKDVVEISPYERSL